MARRNKKRKLEGTAAKFATGQRIRVRKGVASPDYPDIPLGGWAGVVRGRPWGAPEHYGIRWSEETMANVHPVYLRRCERDDYVAEEAELPAEALEPDQGGPLAMEQPTSLITPPLSPDDQDDRVRAIFGLTSDDPLPEVSPQTQRTYYDYLTARLSFPFKGGYADNFRPHAPTLLVTGLKELSPDGVQSIMADALDNDRPAECPLWNLFAEEDQIHELIDDYGYWFYHFGGETPEDDDHESEEHNEEHDAAARPSPIVPQAKVGRNDPCPCGSGKKYKKCCLKKEGEQPRGGVPEAKSFNEMLKGVISETFQQRPRRRDVPAEPKDTAYQIKITLRHTDPPIWRRVQLPDCTLERLHHVIQVAMGWGDGHLHVFRVGKAEYSDSRVTRDSFSGARQESSMTLSGLVEQGARKFEYEYDFGDSWEHEIEIEETMPEEKKLDRPVCIAGEMACPPEDCGGLGGYYELVEALENPDDPDYAERLEWAGDYDPEAFDAAGVNRRLRRF